MRLNFIAEIIWKQWLKNSFENISSWCVISKTIISDSFCCMILDGDYNPDTDAIFLFHWQAMAWSTHSLASPSLDPFDLHQVSKSRSFSVHVAKINTCLLFPSFSLPPLCTYSNSPNRPSLLVDLFSLCPFSLHACILPHLCLANDLLIQGFFFLLFLLKKVSLTDVSL